MNNTFSLQQISKTGNLDSNLISRHYKLNLMANFLRMKNEKRKLKQSEIANQLGYSSSTLQKYKNVINMVSLNRIQPNHTIKRTKKGSNTKFYNDSQGEQDFKKPRLTPYDLKETSNEPVKNKRNKIEGGDPGNNQIGGKDFIEQAFP